MVLSGWGALVIAVAAAAGGAGYLLGRRYTAWRRVGPLPSDEDHVLELLRRAHRAIAAVSCRADGHVIGNTHPRGVPRAVVERATATARLAMANEGAELLGGLPAVIAVGHDGVGIGLAFEAPPTPEQVERAQADLWRLAVGLASAGRPSFEAGRSRWSAESWLEIPETVAAAAGALCWTVGKRVGRPVALVLRDEVRGILRVMHTSHGADQRLEGTSALPHSAVARAVVGGTPVAATSPEDLLGHPRADRRRAEREGFALPVLDGRIAIGALVVFGPPASLPTELRAEAERIVGLAAPRISHLQALEVQQTRARTDELTGLPNRRGLNEAMAGWSGTQAALLVLDIDHFKRLNDAHGHVAGDAALRHLATVLGRVLRDADVPARIGGEEFALWLPDTALDAATDVGERVRLAVEGSPVLWQGRTIPLTCSVGVAAQAGTAADPGNLYPIADAALYRAKQGGRNRVEVARPSEARSAARTA